MTGQKILITAGFGHQARSAIPRLAAAGFHVRAMRASARPGPGPLDIGAREVVCGDAADPEDAFRAMQGVDIVYHVGPTFHPREKAMALNMIDQARRAGVRHFVFSSVLHPIITGLPQHLIKRDIEEYLLTSSVNFTILQPADYMQMTVLGVLPEQNLYMASYESNHREALVDLDDVAEVLVRVAREGEPHFGATYELSSGENLDKDGLTKSASEAFGRPFTMMRYPANYDHRPEIFGHVDASHARHQMDLLRQVHDWYEHNEFLGSGTVLAMLLGRRPTTFTQFCRKHFGLPA